jgi:hypothetical protein
MGDEIPLNPDQPWFVCIACDTQQTRRTAPHAIRIGEFWFCSIQCHTRWITDGRPGMT